MPEPFRNSSKNRSDERVSAPTAVIPTSIGPMGVRALDGHHLLVTAPENEAATQRSVELFRVRYTVHLELVAARLIHGTSAGRRAADVPALERTGFAITVDGLAHALRRVKRDRSQGWHPTDAARRVLLDQLLPELAHWLLSPDGASLVAGGEAFDLAEVAAVADYKAAALREAVAELECIAARALRGEHIGLAERDGVRAGYRLIPPT